MVSVRLRGVTGTDLDAILRLERELFGEEAWSRQMLEGELAQRPASRHYLVADDDGMVVGYAGLLTGGSQADVLTIAVALGRWGEGIGTGLLDALLAEAARRGCTEVFLEVRTDNTRAQQLYRRYGFTEIGIRRGYYQPSGADALVMRLAGGPEVTRRSAGPGGGPEVTRRAARPGGGPEVTRRAAGPEGGPR
jgi:[ribosomal protein S18]-alanine N-acetyltransferase